MLKKWLRKRRKSSGKGAEGSGTEGQSSNRKSKRRGSKAGLKKDSKNKSPSRKSQYTNIEKDQHHEPEPPCLHETLMKFRDSSSKDESDIYVRSRKKVQINTPYDSKWDRRGQDVKREVPLVRIRPIEGPRQRIVATSTSSPAQVIETPLSSPSIVEEEEVIETPLKISSLANQGTQTEESSSLPPNDIPEIKSTASFLTQLSFNQPSVSREDPPASHPSPTSASPSPLAYSDHPTLSRELSFLGVASPPSIDTALFAFEEEEKQSKKNVDMFSTDPIIAETGSPPALIETIMPMKPFEAKSPPRKQHTPPFESEESESDVSAKSKSELRRELSIDKPFRDKGFLTAKFSQSGTGSRKLQLWLDEIKRSIEAQRSKVMADFDRYHIGDKKFSEEKSDKADSSAFSLSSTSPDRRKDMINEALIESIEKSKVDMTTAPRGILKSKVVETGTIRHDSFTRDDEDYDDDYEEDEFSDASDLSGAYSEEGDEEEEEPASDQSSDGEKLPIKAFSFRQRQETDEETSQSRSGSRSGSEIVYETLRQFSPSVSGSISRDDTLRSTGSSHFFYSTICDVGDALGYEDDLRHMDDVLTISDETSASRSTASRSIIATGGERVGCHGWLCFSGAF